MKRLWAVLILSTLLTAMGGTALAQPVPESHLGFMALADQIPEVVGQPLENEHWGANGDSLQQTTTGLMVWRKADNWTAFTNESRTWVNGPYGVMERGNEQRFEWEGGSPASQASAPQPTQPATPTSVPTAASIPAALQAPVPGSAPPLAWSWPTIGCCHFLTPRYPQSGS